MKSTEHSSASVSPLLSMESITKAPLNSNHINSNNGNDNDNATAQSDKPDKIVNEIHSTNNNEDSTSLTSIIGNFALNKKYNDMDEITQPITTYNNNDKSEAKFMRYKRDVGTFRRFEVPTNSSIHTTIEHQPNKQNTIDNTKSNNDDSSNIKHTFSPPYATEVTKQKKQPTLNLEKELAQLFLDKEQV